MWQNLKIIYTAQDTIINQQIIKPFHQYTSWEYFNEKLKALVKKLFGTPERHLVRDYHPQSNPLYTATDKTEGQTNKVKSSRCATSRFGVLIKVFSPHAYMYFPIPGRT